MDSAWSNTFENIGPALRDPYWFLHQVVMPDDILAQAKFYLPVQWERMATEWHVNGKFA